MVDDDEPDLTPAELAAFQALPREAQPPPWLEDRVVAALPSGRPGYRHASPRWRIWAWRAAALAAAVVLFLGGFLAGRRQPRAIGAGAGDQLYLLLLLQDASFRPPPSASEAELVGEYDAWAEGLGRKGTVVLARKLADSGWLLNAGRPAAGLPVREARMSGLFLLRTTSEAQAIALARTCPHLRYGGRIELRRLIWAPGTKDGPARR
ncbi:MAG: hypothetical protein JOZ15_08170 [Acidobacteria bacterium]|nr:hypothetical protein [Acidobacteriota bacterium]